MAANARKATVVDALRLWRHMRPIDRMEASAVTRWPVLLTLLWGVLCTEVVALYCDGELLALYGVRPVPADPRVGLIWMLSTNAVAKHKRAVIEACAAFVVACAPRYGALGNAVCAKNGQALRFVRRLGFTVHEHKPMELGGETFFPIVRISCAV